jgi:lipoyl(octanoyl) transferase
LYQNSAGHNSCRIVSIGGILPYAPTMRLQEQIREMRRMGAIGDTVLLLEHQPTITLGRGSHKANVLTDLEALNSRGIAVVESDRGGDVTYHMPGQLVGYPILDLERHGRDLHLYLRRLEQTLILMLGALGVSAGTVAGRTGVWVGDSKIAAIGIKVSRWVTSHGFALNISPDLGPMRRDIIPCGIADKDVTSLAELGVTVERSKIERLFCVSFADVFGVSTEIVHVPFEQALLAASAGALSPLRVHNAESEVLA